jgi:hypothetical protein
MDNKLTLFDLHVFQEFVHPGEVVEVRILHFNGKWNGQYARGTVAGYFDDHELFCKEVERADELDHKGIYFTLQVIDPRLIARSFNRLKSIDTTTSDKEVLSYRWLPVDLDSVRPSGISANDSELAEALKLRKVVGNYLVNEMDFPGPILAMSGNGGHVLCRLPDIPVTEENQKFIKNILNGLSDRFTNDRVKIDTTVFNPGRIWRLYGTTCKKGDAVPGGPGRDARPHRKAYIDDLGD